MIQCFCYLFCPWNLPISCFHIRSYPPPTLSESSIRQYQSLHWCLKSFTGLSDSFKDKFNSLWELQVLSELSLPIFIFIIYPIQFIKFTTIMPFLLLLFICQDLTWSDFTYPSNMISSCSLPYMLFSSHRDFHSGSSPHEDISRLSEPEAYYSPGSWNHFLP